MHATPVPVACLLLALLPTRSESASVCDPVLADQRALLETIIEVRGGERYQRALSVPARAEFIAVAREDGVDATLRVTDTASRTIGIADSPIRRTGIQRVVFASPAAAGYFVELVGKEHAGVTGQVEVRVLALKGSAAGASCREAHSVLASADAAYAAGQAVSLGTEKTPGANAAQAYESAVSRYKVVVSNLTEAMPTPLLAQAEHSVAAVLYLGVQDWPQSSAWAEKAAQTYARIEDEYGKARVEAIHAAALMEIAVSLPSQSSSTETPRGTSDMLTRARQILSSLATLHARRGESIDQALALNNIGLAYYLEGLNEQAIRAYQQPLLLYEQLGERFRQAQVVTNIALAEYELGRLEQSIPRYQVALGMIAPQEDPKLYAFALQNSALANWAGGNFDAALREYDQALELWRATQSVRGQARCLHGIGSVYDTLGDQALALAFYTQALTLRSAILDARGRTASLRAIARILRNQGRAGEALKMHQEALSLASNASTRAGILVQIARDFDALGQPREALSQLDAVLRQEASANDFMGAQALLERSKHRLAVDDLDGADADLRSAMKVFRAYDSVTDQFTAWVGLARVKQARGAVDEALAMLDKALALAEEVRLQSANPELRANLLQPLRPAFDLKISLLARQYFKVDGSRHATQRQRYAMRALMTAEQSRARALADFEGLDSTAPGVAPRLVQERQAIYRDLAARRLQLEALLDRATAADPRVEALRTSIASLRHRLNQIDATIGAASAPDLSMSGEHAPFDLRSVPTDAAIVEYWLGTDDALAWVVTRERVVMVSLGPSSRITDAAQAFHTALSSLASVPASERLRLSQRLHALVIEPVNAHFLSKNRLIFAPDGALHYVPFAALRTSGANSAQFLIERHNVADTPSIHMLLRPDPDRRRPQPTKQMLLVADPVYDLGDTRLAVNVAKGAVPRADHNTRSPLLLRAGSGLNSLQRLPGTEREAAAIAALLPRDGVDRLQGFSASRDRFLSSRLEQYRFIHVASHAVTDADVPQLSALILSTRDSRGQPVDGRVLAADFMNTKLSSDSVVLSACETALGKNVGGEGLVGLRYVILARGAKSVTSSLWQVPDEAAVQLMSAMYSSVLRRQSSVDAALGDAMRAMIASQMTDPGMWGAFVATVRELTTRSEEPVQDHQALLPLPYSEVSR